MHKPKISGFLCHIRKSYIVTAIIFFSHASIAEDQTSSRAQNNQPISIPNNQSQQKTTIPLNGKPPATTVNTQKDRNIKATQSIPETKSNPQSSDTNGWQNPVGELQPVLHARQAGLTYCMDNVIRQSGKSINSKHSAITTWSKNKPNENAFQSIIGLSETNTLTPNGLALIFAAPINLNKCEGQSVEIHPAALSCTKAHANLLEVGRTLGEVGNLPVIEAKDGSRIILIPTTGGGCVIVSVHIN